MKINSIVSKKNEWIIPAAIMFIKALFVLPLIENIYFVFDGRMRLISALPDIGVALCILAFSVLYSLILAKSAEKAGEASVLLLAFAVADPLATVTANTFFHAFAIVLTLVWIAVSLKVENRIIVTAVSVVSAAVISFIMPCAVFTFVLAGILVAVISDSEKTISKVITAVVSAASAIFFASLSSGELRLKPVFIRLFYNLGSTESHAISAGRLEYGFSLSDIMSQFGTVTLACLPFFAFVIYVAVKVATDKISAKKAVCKVFTVAAILLPFAGSLVASALCYGKGAVTSFMFAPAAVILALLIGGNKAVTNAVGDVCSFAKKHPAVALVAIVWIACHATSFAAPNRLFNYAVYFSV